MKTWDDHFLWDYLQEEVTPAERDAFEESLLIDADLRRRLEAMQTLDASLPNLPREIPGTQVSQRFYQWLDEQESPQSSTATVKRLAINWKTIMAVAAGIALIAIFAQQWWTMQRLNSLQNQLATSHEKEWIDKLKNDPSTSQRLVALNEAVQNPLDQKVLDALFDVAAKDPSPNVRLASVSVLSDHLDNSQVKSFLTGLLQHETDPSVLIEIINAFGIRKDKSVVPELENFMQRDEVLNQIKGEAQMSINKINSIE